MNSYYLIMFIPPVKFCIPVSEYVHNMYLMYACVLLYNMRPYMTDCIAVGLCKSAKMLPNHER